MSKVKKTRKNYFNCARRNQFKQKALIVKKAEEISEYVKAFGLKVNEMILSPNDEDPFTTAKTRITVNSSEIPERRITFNYLKAKDMAQLSDRNYCIQKKALSGIQKIPGIQKIVNLQCQLNEFFDISENSFGFFCTPEQKITYVCEKFLMHKPKFLNFTFNIKLSIDSTSISKKNVTLLNVSFNLMDDPDFSNNVNGTFVLASFEIEKESYDNVKESLKELLILLENVKNIKIKEQTYKITFFLGCDYKMIRILYGQKAANAIKG
jgi:hypothetical protein